MKISPKQYAQTLYDLTMNKSEDEVKEIIAKFVANLKKEGLLNKSKEIIAEFKNIYNQEQKILPVRVISAHKLTKEEKNNLREKLKNKYQVREVELTNQIDPSLQGGFKLIVDENVIDESVAEGMRLLKKALQ